MSDVVHLPVKATDPDAPINLRAWAQRGGAPIASLDAVLRWCKGFDPHDAAAACLLASSYEAATTLWQDHISALRCALHSMGLDAEMASVIVTEYTGATRREVKILRNAQMSRQDWAAETFASFNVAAQ